MRVITYGTFDTLHYGHIRLLKRAHALGTHLTVALSTDAFNETKGKTAKFTWEQRKSDLEALSYVDEIIPEENWDQKLTDVKDHNIDIFTMGDDWVGKFDFLKEHCNVVYLERTQDISSTMIRNASKPSDDSEVNQGKQMDDSTKRTHEIHKITLDELTNPTGTLKTRRLFDELKSLQPAPLTREWLEAAILISIFRVARPMKTLVFINKLRAMAKTKDQKKQFEKFHADMAAYLSPIMITNHGYIEEQKAFGAQSHPEIWAGIKSHMKALKDAGHKVFLNSGTLLGLVRDGKLIDHDNDIDIGLILDANSEDEAVIAWDKVTQELRGMGILSEEMSEPQNGMLRLKHIAGYTVDVFPAWFADNKVYVFPHTFGEIEPKDVYPFRTCKITGLDQPAKPEKMLAINYGPGWDKKDPLWKFVRPAGFDSFLKKVSHLK